MNITWILKSQIIGVMLVARCYIILQFLFSYWDSYLYPKINVYSNSEIDFYWEKKDMLFLILFCLKKYKYIIIYHKYNIFKILND